MALSFSHPLANFSSPKVSGSVRADYVKVTLDSAYPNTGTYATSGYAIKATDVSMSELLYVQPGVSAGSGTGAVTFGHWDAVNGRLHLYDGTDGIEWENNTDFTAKGPGGNTADFLYAEVVGH